MLKKTIFSLVITAIILFAGCNKTDSPVSPTQSDVLIPLKVGNMWITKNNFQGSISFDTLKIVKDSVINGEIWYCAIDNFLITTNRNDGVYYILSDTNGNYHMVMNYKYPANVGDKWIPINDSTSNITLLSKNETINVKAGTFVCFKYQNEGIFKYPNTPGKVIDWICPGIGIIKTELRMQSNQGSDILLLSSELQSYKLK